MCQRQQNGGQGTAVPNSYWTRWRHGHVLMRRLNVLVLAYACNPFGASEEGVGWGVGKDDCVLS